MREQGSYLNNCLIGSGSCDFGDQHELALVRAVMQTIKHYGEREHVEPCPKCLRDALLNVAALLHLEAAKIGVPSFGRSSVEAKGFDHDFAEVARARLEAVADIVPGNIIQFKQ
jgi:hypothetical protein